MLEMSRFNYEKKILIFFASSFSNILTAPRNIYTIFCSFMLELITMKSHTDFYIETI